MPQVTLTDEEREAHRERAIAAIKEISELPPLEPVNDGPMPLRPDGAIDHDKYLSDHWWGRDWAKERDLR